MREQRRQRIAVARGRRKIFDRVIMLFCVVIIAVVCVGVISSGLSEPDEPETDAGIAEFVESQGGEVTKIVPPGDGRGGSGPSYVDVVFDGEQSRCSYDLITQTPRSLMCDPVVNR